MTATTLSAGASLPNQAKRFVELPMPSLAYTEEVAAETAHLYERVKHHIPAIEWPVYAPYIAAINRLKKERNAVILAHNYQTPEIFHCVADIVGDSHPVGARGHEGRGARSSCSAACTSWRDVETAQSAKERPDPGHAGWLLSRRIDHRCRRTAAARALSRRSDRHLCEHLGRSEGRERHLLHLGQRRRGRRELRGRYGALHSDEYLAQNVAARPR